MNDIVEKGYSKKDAKINEREEVIVTKNIENDFVSIETNYKNNINDINNNEIYIEIYKLKKIKYPKIESSFARIKINKPDCIFCFLPGDLVLIITSEAKFCFAKIEKKGGYCIFTEEKEIKKK